MVFFATQPIMNDFFASLPAYFDFNNTCSKATFCILVVIMEAILPTSIPPLKGLVLAGGESTRMGFDKGLINYHGLPQRDYLLHLLEPYTVQSFLSCRPGQIDDMTVPFIEDTYTDLGPFGGILSAFKFDPQSAWLVVACDFPLLDHRAIEQLISERVSTSIATSFLDPNTLMPEPWITILEPNIYPILLDYHKRGKSSLRGVLVDYNSAVIRPVDADILLNANTPEEESQIRMKIGI
jgi:molybdopterin-guanine dinucleotide biosynthesis protein A